MTGPQLRRMRQRAALTMEAAAQMLDTTRQTLYRWETGRIRIPKLKIASIQSLMGAAQAAPSR